MSIWIEKPSQGVIYLSDLYFLSLKIFSQLVNGGLEAWGHVQLILR